MMRLQNRRPHQKKMKTRDYAKYLAAIDIGTNTILLLAKDRVSSAVLADELRFARLGEGLGKTGSFSIAAMQRAHSILTEYATILKRLDVDLSTEVLAVATSASREAANAVEFYDAIRDKLGIDVQIISGDEEAYLAFLGGLLPHQNPFETAILDIGGGSTELSFLDASDASSSSNSSNFNDSTRCTGRSMPLGCVRGLEEFFPNANFSSTNIHAFSQNVRHHLTRLEPEVTQALRSRTLTAIAGTPTTLAALELELDDWQPERIDGLKISRDAVTKWLKHLAGLTAPQRQIIPALKSGRSDLMIPGLIILAEVLNYLDHDSFTVSTRGLRHGVLFGGLGGTECGH